jgi:hypothetical protein
MAQTATWDPASKRMVVKDNGQASAGTNSAGHTVWFGVTGDLLAKLSQYAKEDGFDLKSDTDTGRKAKVGKAVKLYLDAAVKEFVATRDKIAVEEAKTVKTGKK